MQTGDGLYGPGLDMSEFTTTRIYGVGGGVQQPAPPSAVVGLTRYNSVASASSSAAYRYKAKAIYAQQQQSQQPPQHNYGLPGVPPPPPQRSHLAHSHSLHLRSQSVPEAVFLEQHQLGLPAMAAAFPSPPKAVFQQQQHLGLPAAPPPHQVRKRVVFYSGYD